MNKTQLDKMLFYLMMLGILGFMVTSMIEERQQNKRIQIIEQQLRK